MNDSTRQRAKPAHTDAPVTVLIAGSAQATLDNVATALRSHFPTYAVIDEPSDLSRLAAIVGNRRPDVLVVLQPQAGDEVLDVIERLTHADPMLTAILLCDERSPDFLVRAMRAGVREVLPATSSDGDLTGAIERIGQKRRSLPEQHCQVLAFVSCKGGGSGATFLASNVAYALAAEEGKRVLLIDLNLQWGDAVYFVSDGKPPMTLAGIATQIHRIDAAFLASSLVRPHPNLGVLAAPDDPVQALDVKPEHIDTLLRIARSQFDYVVLDSGRALDAVTVRALDYADVIFPVLQLSLPFVRDGKRLMQAFRALEYAPSRVHIVVNRYERGGDITLQDMETALGTKAVHTFPNDYARVVKSINQGIPILKLARGSAIAKSVREFAHEVATEPAKAHSGWFDRILSRT